MADLSCKQLVELVTDYGEGALYCPGCAFGGLTEEQLPETARVALLQAFRDWNAAGGR